MGREPRAGSMTPLGVAQHKARGWGAENCSEQSPAAEGLEGVTLFFREVTLEGPAGRTD